MTPTSFKNSLNQPSNRRLVFTGQTYTWDPSPTKQANDLKPVKDMRTYHEFSYYGFFKPSIAEVLAQIPVELRDWVVAFEIIKHQETLDDLRQESEALDAGYHVATTRLYSK